MPNRLLLFFPLMQACATVEVAGPIASHAAIASLRPVPIPYGDDGDHEDDDDTDSPDVAMAAGALIERGISDFHRDDHEQAVEFFRRALDTGRLNDAGRTLAYWHVFMSNMMLGRQDLSNEALSSFVTVGQDVLDLRDDVQFAVSVDGDFVERFELQRKLSQGRAILSARWALDRPGYGRSLHRPVLVRSMRELLHFLAIVSDCRDVLDEATMARHCYRDATRRIEEIKVDCGSGQQESFFFDLR
jgi:hypothetical protein